MQGKISVELEENISCSLPLFLSLSICRQLPLALLFSYGYLLNVGMSCVFVALYDFLSLPPPPPLSLSLSLSIRSLSLPTSVSSFLFNCILLYFFLCIVHSISICLSASLNTSFSLPLFPFVCACPIFFF